MFSRLLTAWPRSDLGGPGDAGAPADGVRSAVADLAGATLGDGLYRLHTASSAAAADQNVVAAYPEFASRVACFGFDWLGRQFSLDSARGGSADPEVLLFDVGAGEALEIPVAFSDFHDQELVEQSEAALATSFFARWLRLHPEPIPFHQCVGYQVPLFLSGPDTLENLELTDTDLYWSQTGQLRVASAGLSPGTPVQSIQRVDPD